MKNSFILLTLICLGIPKIYSQTFTCGDTLIDSRDGQKYATVLIGSNCWFKQNLNYGTTVPSFSSSTIHSDQFNNSIPEKYAQNNNNSNLLIYGGLYEWAELMNYATVSGGQGLCPNGWHVSTDAEWSNLISVAGATMHTSSAGKGGNKLKKIGEGFGLGAGTDNIGFSAKHGGDRDGFGIFYGLGARAIFFTSTLASPGQAYQYTLWDNKDTIQRLTIGVATTAFACRCVRDLGTGFREGSMINKFSIYPNPANSIINIIATDLTYEIKIILKDISGREVLTSGSKQIDLSSLQNGLYFIEIFNAKTEEQLGFKKVIKN